MNAYARIAEALPRFDRFQTVFQCDANLQHALGMVYEDILEFHQCSYRFFKRGCQSFRYLSLQINDLCIIAWHVFFDSLWKDFEARFHGILARLVRHRDLVDKEASSIAIVEAQKWRIQHQLEVDQQERRRQDFLLQDSISWLEIQDRAQEDYLDKLSHRRQPGTCEWVLRNSHLASWMDNRDGEPLLWLKGIPGAGRLQ